MPSHVEPDPVPAISERDAAGPVANIFADIRDTLNVEVVNLVWRHLATMPGALEWVWSTVRPLYSGPGITGAVLVRKNLNLPRVPTLSHDTLVAAGLTVSDVSSILAILDSYQHTNALALVCLSAFLAQFELTGAAPTVAPTRGAGAAARVATHRVALPRLVPMAEMPPAVARLVQELNGFGEDSDLTLVASMYRHLSHWPTYLALVRTLLVPLHESGELKFVVAEARKVGEMHGRDLASEIPARPPLHDVEPVLSAVRRFVRHPVARMTAICAIIRSATID